MNPTRRPGERGLRTDALIAVATLATLATFAIEADAQEANQRELRVCADPANLPYSNEREEGFENRIAHVLADDLGMTVLFVWSQQRRGFLRRTLNAGECEVVIGWPAGQRGMAQTQPYYGSSYVFVTATHRTSAPTGLDDPRLRDWRIGLQAIGADGSTTPPASSLAKRGIVDKVIGFPMWGDEGDGLPQARIVDAVASGAIDVAIVWGPFAGYFAKRYRDKLTLTPVAPDAGQPALSFQYGMALGVRQTERPGLLPELQAALHRREIEIKAILRDYGIPFDEQPLAASAHGVAAALISKPFSQPKAATAPPYAITEH
jgi:mxaJ protein